MPAASVFGLSPTAVAVHYKAHAGQAEVSEKLRENFASPTPASIVEVIASRGWGKTLWLVCEVLVPFLERNPTAKVMWVAPTYQTAMSPIDDVFKGSNELTGERYVPEFCPQGRRIWEFKTTQSGPVLQWYNGATVLFRSADSPDSIVSKGFNRIIIDEAALIEEQVFTQQILGTARKAGIKIFMISSPRGKKHWTYRMYCKGQDEKETEYLSFRQPYTKNPYFNETLKKLIKDIPEWIYRQEYLAEFIEDGDSVFRSLDNVFMGAEISFSSNQQEWSLPIEDVEISTPQGKVLRKAHERSFVVGMDIAKAVDYSVIWAMDLETGRLVYYRRLNKMDYRDLLDLVSKVCKQYNQAPLIFDATGVGQGLADMLNNYDIVTHPFIFTNESKNDIINRLILAVEYQEIMMPNITTVRNELSVFTYTMTRTGKISYAAPAGFHDDIVMSLALANWYRKENGIGDTVDVVEDVIGWNTGPEQRRRSCLEEMAEDDD